MIPALFIGGLFFSLKGAVVALALGFVGLGALVSFCERRLAAAYRVSFQDREKFSVDLREGLQRSLAQAVIEIDLEYSKKLPRLIVFPAPVPRAFVARSIFGSGTIFLSQGLISSLSERELRRVFIRGVLRIQQPGVFLKSFCSMLAIWVLKVIPQAGLDLIYGRSKGSAPRSTLHPFSAFCFLIPFQGVRFLISLAMVGPGRMRTVGFTVNFKDSLDFVDATFGNRIFPPNF